MINDICAKHIVSLGGQFTGIRLGYEKPFELPGFLRFWFPSRRLNWRVPFRCRFAIGPASRLRRQPIGSNINLQV